jgi:hypothetical protein
VSDNYIPGEVVRLLLNTFDFAGAVADPGTVVLKVKQPDGTVITHTPDVVRDGTGVYHADLALTAAGVWAYRWELTTPNAGAAEGVIQVQKSKVI